VSGQFVLIPFKERCVQIVKPVLSVVLGLVLGLMVCKLAGEDPVNVLGILVRSAFGSKYDFGMTLFYTTPLVFTGLSVAFAFHAGLFNIGAEGQLAIGTLALVSVGAAFPHLSPWIAPFLGVLASAIGGGLWGLVPGWLRARRGSHEVINTIMFNFIAAGLCSWVTLYLLRNPNSQNPETDAVGVNYMIHQFGFFDSAPVSLAFLLAVGMAAGVWFILWKTVLGFEIRAVGQSESAARAAGIDAAHVRMIAMTIAGALAGMVGVGEVLGHAGRFRLGFSPGYGFTGIAVALLGRNQPLGIIASAFLFGALHKGTTDLDLETENVTRDFSLILQALVILCVSADGVWSLLGERFQFLFRKKEKIHD
jgi:simple sugar transport system permease protein